MIYIVSNGEPYSGHAFFFVDAPEPDRYDFLRYMEDVRNRVVDGYRPCSQFVVAGRVAATAGVEWLAGPEVRSEFVTMTVDDFYRYLIEYKFYDDRADHVPAPQDKKYWK